MIKKYKEIYDRFKKLSLGKKVIYLIFTLLLTLLIMVSIYGLSHFVKGLLI